ncbi:MAG: histidinol-phosphate transaminase [Candidatus Eisenbacteria bacterium]|nr:histidinol-phosphate transaminase [Candidatus Eisenbacteria bacterium]
MSVALKSLVRENVYRLRPYVPGKPVEILERQLGVKNALKFASNENPLGPSPLALKAIRESNHLLNRYPDSSSYFLREKLGEHFGFPMEQFIVGNGTTQLIELVCHLFLGPGDEAVIAEPSFLMYPICIELMGARAVSVPLRDHKHDLSAMAKAVSPKTKVVFVCNPNNPTGTIVTKSEVEQFLSKIPESVVVVFDEAYHEYVEHSEYPDAMEYLREGKLVIVLRTFSKVYALAGLRVGYGVASEEMIFLLNSVSIPFTATCIGQVAALASLADDKQISRSLKVTSEGMQFLREKLTDMGLEAVESYANFMAVDLKTDAREACAELERKALILRAVGLGLPASFVRITVGTQRENERLVEGLKEVLRGKKRKKEPRRVRVARVEKP